MNVLVLVRSWRFLQTRKMTNPFPTIVKMQRNQPRTQNHISIEIANFQLLSSLERGEFLTAFERSNCADVAIEVLPLRNSQFVMLRYCYVKCNYGCIHRSPLNVLSDALTNRVWSLFIGFQEAWANRKFKKDRNVS